MAFNPFKVLRSLLIQKENSLNPDKIEIIPNGSAGTTTTIQSSQTTSRTLTLPDATTTLVGNNASQTLTNKTIDADLNTITNIENADIKVGAAIDASKLANGSVSNTEFQFLDGVTSAIQTQLDGKQPTGNYITALTGDVTASGPGSVASTIANGAVTDAKVASGISAAKIGTGVVDNTEFSYLDGVTSAIQTQLNGKASTALDNLGTTSLNADLLPSGAGARNLGSASLPFGSTHTETVTRQTSGNLTISTSAGNLTLNPSANIDANNKLITNVAAPVSAGDAVNKEYADSIAAGFDPKAAVRVATTAPLGGTYSTTPSNGRFTGAATSVDGVTLVAGDRVLVKDQVDQKQNGIYVYDGAGQYTRASDSDGSPASEVSAGNFTFATQGTLNSASGFVLLGNGVLTLNTDNLAWTQSSGGASGASRFLDNLLSPTAINQDLLPGTDVSRNLGSASLRYTNLHSQTVNTATVQSPTATALLVQSSDAQTATIRSGSSTSNTGIVTVQSGNSSATSGAVSIFSGTGNNTGAVNIQTSNATATSGNININTGTGTTRGDVSVSARSTQINAGALNIQQGQTAVPVASQQSITIPSSGDSEGIVQVTASDSSVRNVLAAGPEGLPQAQNLILNGDAEGKLTSSTSIFVPYATVEAVTFQDAGDTVTLLAHGLQNGQTVSFLTIVSTTGISINTLYYVVNAATNTFQVATTPGGAALALTTNGSGTMARGLPLTGTGGSPNVTASVTATTPLSGSKSYLLVKDAVNRQGQGWSIPFTVNQANRARVLSIKFDYMVSSGTFVAGTSTADSDVTVWIYDVTNSTLIQPSSFRLLSNSTSIVDQFQAEFQTSVTGSSYRLIFHCATTSAAAYTLEVDNIIVSPSEYVFGTPISDVISAGSTTISAVTTAPTKGTIVIDSVRYNREGAFAVVKYRFEQSSAGTVGSGDYLWSLPSGLSFDSNLALTYTGIYGAVAAQKFLQQATGKLYTSNPASGNIEGIIPYDSTRFRVVGRADFTSIGFIGSGFFNFTSTGFGIEFTIKVPIAGWSSSVQMADSTSTRVVAVHSWLTSNQSVTANVTNIPFNGIDIDTHAAFSNGVFTCPVSGIYEVRLHANETVNTNYALFLYRNGVNNRFIAMRATSGPAVGVTTIQLNTGDTLSVRSDTNQTFAGAASQATSNISYISINRISGPSQIASSEVCGALANTTTQATSSGVFGTLICTNVLSNTHGAYNSATGVFTCPRSGFLDVSGAACYGAAGTGFTWGAIGVFRNGVEITRTQNINANFGFPTGNSIETKMLPVTAGDLITVRFQPGGFSPALTSGFVSFEYAKGTL